MCIDPNPKSCRLCKGPVGAIHVINVAYSNDKKNKVHEPILAPWAHREIYNLDILCGFCV